MAASLSRRAVAELLGTFFLVFFGCGVVIMDPFPNAHWGVMGIALVHALILSVAVSATMATSGGVLNPAISLGLWSIGKLTPRETGVYIGAQLGGAALAGLMMKLALPANVAMSGTIAYGTPMVNTQFGTGAAILIEAILTFALASMVMGTAVSKMAPKIGGFGIGLTLIPAIMVGGPITGAALNPARAFGPSLVSGVWVGHAVYWIGPVIGAVIAMQVWQRFVLRDEA